MNINNTNPLHQAKLIVEQLTTNAKNMNQNLQTLDYMFEYIDKIKSSLLKAGFRDRELFDMVILMLKKMEIEADNPQLKTALFHEAINSDFFDEIAKIHFYTYTSLKKRGYNHEQTMLLLDAFQ